MLGYCFSVLAILIPHRFYLALHASSMMFFPHSMFLLKKKKKLWEKLQEILFSFSWHVRYCLYFCLISQFIVH
jgi:hypothetical protein